MASIIRNSFHIQNAKNFIDTFIGTGTPVPDAGQNAFYVALVREGSSTSAQKWAAEPVPDGTSGVNTLGAAYGLNSSGITGVDSDVLPNYSNSIAGFVRVGIEDITLACRNPLGNNNTNWTNVGSTISGAQRLQTNVPAASAFNTSLTGTHIVVNEEKYVYLVTGTPSDVPVDISTEPTLYGDVIANAVNYKFLYKINSKHVEDYAKFMTDEFMPVNYGPSLETTGTYGTGKENDISYKLTGAKYVMINIKLPNDLGAGTENYRAAYLIANPRLGDNTGFATAVKYDAYGTTATTILRPTFQTDFTGDSGDIMLWDNFYPIQRTGTSSEKHLFVIEF